MSKKQLLILVVVLVLGYAITLGGAWFMLQDDTGQAVLDSLAQVDSLQQLAELQPEGSLNLTLDLARQATRTAEGAMMMPGVSDSTRDAQQKAALAKEREQQVALADSVSRANTEPVQEEVQQAKEKVEETEVKVSELENLLAMLSADADSIDQANAKRLAKIIESMRADDAAAVMQKLGSHTSARLLVTMRQRQAAKILAAMPRDRAAEVARYLSQAYEKSAI